MRTGNGAREGGKVYSKFVLGLEASRPHIAIWGGERSRKKLALRRLALGCSFANGKARYMEEKDQM